MTMNIEVRIIGLETNTFPVGSETTIRSLLKCASCSSLVCDVYFEGNMLKCSSKVVDCGISGDGEIEIRLTDDLERLTKGLSRYISESIFNFNVGVYRNLSRNLSPNTTYEGESLISRCVVKGNTDCLREMINSTDVDLNKRNDEDQSLLNLAIVYKKNQVFDLLSSNGCVAIKADILTACNVCNEYAFDKLISNCVDVYHFLGMKDVNELMICAIERKNTHIFNTLVAKNANVSQEIRQVADDNNFSLNYWRVGSFNRTL